MLHLHQVVDKKINSKKNNDNVKKKQCESCEYFNIFAKVSFALHLILDKEEVIHLEIKNRHDIIDC